MYKELKNIEDLDLKKSIGKGINSFKKLALDKIQILIEAFKNQSKINRYDVTI